MEYLKKYASHFNKENKYHLVLTPFLYQLNLATAHQLLPHQVAHLAVVVDTVVNLLVLVQILVTEILENCQMVLSYQVVRVEEQDLVHLQR